jgi:HEAT repeat protein
MKPKAFLCLALALNGAQFGYSHIARADEYNTNAEPRYLDKSLSNWIPLARLEGEPPRIGDARTFTAVTDIGTNAFPWLLHWIHSENPETARLGAEGFGLLGPIAEPVIPELIRLANDWPSSSVWSNAIPALVAIRDPNHIPYALTFLLAEATNATVPSDVRLQVLQSITEGRCMTNKVISALVVCLRDKDWRVAAKAADGLCVYSIEPLVAVPALAACLASRTNAQAGSPAIIAGDLKGDVMVRLSAASALAEFSDIYYYSSRFSPVLEPLYVAQIREAMQPVVPILVKALSDEDWHVAMQAAHALGGMALEPDLVVPALVKSMDNPHQYLQLAAIEALGKFGAAARFAVSALAKRAQDDPERNVGGPLAADALKQIVSQNK